MMDEPVPAFLQKRIDKPVMNAIIPTPFSIAAAEQRQHPRFPVALPATITTATAQASALIHDIAVGGAMIETSLALPPGGGVSLRCGTILVDAKVTWRKCGRIGLIFDRVLGDHDVVEQMDRSYAIAARRSNQRALRVGSGKG